MIFLIHSLSLEQKQERTGPHSFKAALEASNTDMFGEYGGMEHREGRGG